MPEPTHPDHTLTLGELLDRRALAAKELTELNKLAEAKKDIVSAMDGEIMAAMRAAGLETAAGTLAKAVIKHEDVPRITDWEALYDYIRDNNAFYLLQRRPAATAMKDTVKTGETLPGVEMVSIASLSVTKAN